MLAPQTRWLLLQAGRRSLPLWLRAGRVSEPGLPADTQRHYDRMADQVPWPDQQSVRAELALVVLPMAALYTALRQRGRSDQEAVAAVTRGVAVTGRPERRAAGLLLRTSLGGRLYLRAAEFLVDVFYPAPAYKVTWVERSGQRMVLDITQCYAYDTLLLLDAAPATAALCARDDLIYSNLCPQLHWSRTGTLGKGAERCDYCLERVGAETHTTRENDSA